MFQGSKMFWSHFRPVVTIQVNPTCNWLHFGAECNVTTYNQPKSYMVTGKMLCCHCYARLLIHIWILFPKLRLYYAISSCKKPSACICQRLILNWEDTRYRCIGGKKQCLPVSEMAQALVIEPRTFHKYLSTTFQFAILVLVALGQWLYQLLVAGIISAYISVIRNNVCKNVVLYCLCVYLNTYYTEFV